MVRVKICGITRVEDARLAAALGAWAVGFIFHPASPRYITPGEAGCIARCLPENVEKVGVFVDAACGEIRAAAAAAGLTVAQLHGAEPRALVDQVRPHLGDVWKAVRVGDALDPAAIEPYRGLTLLLDTLAADRPGGTGKTFAWELARDAAAFGTIIIAGGLTPENVAMAVRTAHPFAVDVAGGVEAAPGIKDPERMRRFFEAIARAS